MLETKEPSIVLNKRSYLKELSLSKLKELKAINDVVSKDFSALKLISR